MSWVDRAQLESEDYLKPAWNVIYNPFTCVMWRISEWNHLTEHAGKKVGGPFWNGGTAECYVAVTYGLSEGHIYDLMVTLYNKVIFVNIS